MRRMLLVLLAQLVVGLGAFAQSSEKDPLVNGKSVYEKTCLTCHQANGGGVPHMNPPLAHAAFVIGDKEKLIQWVLLGSTTKVPIDGKYYSNNMPPQAALSNQDIADVLTFIRTNFDNKASGITADEVKYVRGSLKK